MVVFTMASARKKHRAAIAPAVQGGPRILVHDINDDRCTGCDACVAVCPTNVLDLVANKSRVLRFEDCIQCEACMFACPTEALVMFPEGSVPPPLKVPEVDENFQTMVPGQYLIGEVAGKPLVKNAANLGRAVVEHMLMTGMQPGALGPGDGLVDVVIVGSGPGGLSAALTCIQRGLSFVVLEKEQMIASTILRYPKGKLVMAEPYDTLNLSLLPVFDAAKEQLIPIWQELLQRLGLRVNQGESVESIGRLMDGSFEVRTTVAAYRGQRVVLSIGTRGKPRTLQVPGENLPKIANLLDDPDEFRGRAVLVVGGGDSAVEAALALADAGAKVMISYRGKGFNRAAPKNKNTIEAYAAEGRIKAKLGSQVLQFDHDSVTLALADGSQKRYANEATFVLIGADPPIAWLEKVGVRFVERPHQYQMGKTDDVVRRYLQRAIECPEDAARAAAQILGGSTGIAPQDFMPMPSMVPPDQRREASQVAMLADAGGAPENVSGPRKWLRSATSIFSNRAGTNAGQPIRSNPGPSTQSKSRRLDGPMPLSEFAKRGREGTSGGFDARTGVSNVSGGTGVHHMHTGHGRRDQLSAGERTRILRMLRDEGGRFADEDSQVYIGSVPPSGKQDFDFDFDGPASMVMPPTPVQMRPDVPAKPAVVVGISQAQHSKRQKKTGMLPPPQAAAPLAPPAYEEAPLHLPDSPLPVPSARPRLPDRGDRGDRGDHGVETKSSAQRSRPPSQAAVARPRSPSQAAPSRPPPRRVPPPFSDDPTRQVDESVLGMLRSGAHARPQPDSDVAQPPSVIPVGGAFSDTEATRMATIDPRQYDEIGLSALDDSDVRPRVAGPRTPPGNEFDEATSVASLDAISAMERARKQGNDDSTRAVNIRNDPSISEIDWDLD